MLNTDLGFQWESRHQGRQLPPFRRVGGREAALYRFHRAMPAAVFEAARFEGSPFTFIEVQTLIDGITVGGHRVTDLALVVGLIDSAKRLRELVRADEFALDKDTSDQLHAIIASSEAIESGHFRGEGKVTGTTTVWLGGFDERYVAPDHGPGGRNLVEIYNRGLAAIQNEAAGDPGLEAVLYATFATLHQFYFDGNKRTARWMMNGHLIMNGLDPIGVPFSRSAEWNGALRRLFQDRNGTALVHLLAGCQLERIARPPGSEQYPEPEPVQDLEPPGPRSL